MGKTNTEKTLQGVLGEIEKIKKLEADLRADGTFPEGFPENSPLYNLLTDKDTKSFWTQYENFVGRYVDSVVNSRLQGVYDNHPEIAGKPEEIYIRELLKERKGELDLSKRRITADDLDRRIADLNISKRIKNLLIREGIEYVGELIQKTEAELFRLPEYGKIRHREVLESLRSYNLHLGMGVNYTTPEKRS